jgi:hypothetical protein
MWQLEDLLLANPIFFCDLQILLFFVDLRFADPTFFTYFSPYKYSIQYNALIPICIR